MQSHSEEIRAVVVDDDVETLNLLCEYLELCQFRIVARARSGEKVAEMYSRYMPDVVILDVMMDGYDGIYALEQIRKTSPDAIVIMVTADLTSDTADRMERLDATSVIYKPFNMKDLVDVVRKYVDSQRHSIPRPKAMCVLQPYRFRFRSAQNELEVIRR